MRNQKLRHQHSFAIILALVGMTGLVLPPGYLWSVTDSVRAQTCVPAPTGMVSWWPGDSSAIDIQSGNNGILQNGVTFAAGKVGQAFNFDGVNDYVRVPHSANLDPGTGSFTLDAWVKTTSTSNQTLVSKYECGGSCPAGALSLYFLSMSIGKVVAEIRDSDGSSPGSLFLMGTSNIADGNFHHVAMLRDTAIGQVRIYVDGALDASAALTSGSDGAIHNNDTEADPLLVGGFFNSGTTTLRDPFTGLIDELEYLNRALSQTEIQAIFNAGSAGKCPPQCTTPPSGMASWWPGDGNAFDIQGGNNGTLQNGATFATGKVGQAFSLDGVNDYVDVGPGFHLDNMTLDAWVFIDPANNTGERRIISKDNFSLSGTRKLFDLQSSAPFVSGNQGRAAFVVLIGSAFDVVEAPTPLAAGWNHIAGLRDTIAGRFELYVNGMMVASKTPTVVGVIDSAVNTVLGRFSPSSALQHFAGRIDEAEIFNRALSQIEIEAIVAAGSAGKCRTCVPPPPGMVNWWPGDGNANDFQGSNNGTPQNGATFSAGKVAQAFSLDGVNGYVSLPDNPARNFGTGNFTIDFWELSSNGGSRMHALSFEPSYGTRNLDFDFNDGVGLAVYWNGTGGNHILAGSQGAYTDGQWHHIALTRSGTTFTLYVDGSAVGSTTYSGPIDLSNSAINYIGAAAASVAGGTSPVFFWGGLIDEVEIFNRALSPSEIQAIVNAGSAGKCKERPPVAACQNVTVAAESGCIANASIDNGSTDADGDTITFTQSPAGPYPLGNTTVTLTVADSKGASSQCTGTVTVVDTTPPQIVALPGDVSYQCASAVPPASPSQATASDNCGGPTISVSDASNGGAGSPSSPLVITRTFTATDTAGNTGSLSQTIAVVDNTPPIITCPVGISVAGNVLGSCSATVNPGTAPATDNCSTAIVSGIRSDGLGLNEPYTLGVTTITWTATDAAGNHASCPQQVTVTNASPVVSITGPPSGSIFAANMPVNFTGTLSDNAGGTHTATWTFDTITQPGTVNETNGVVTASHTFSVAGVYLVKLTVTDNCGGSSTATTVGDFEALVVVYDPGAGWVTGGGWFNSPPGAYEPNPTLTGKANFGFVSKYENGASVPTGNTEFHFKAGDLKFKSTSYEWMVLGGKKAQYKGFGTINGGGTCRFMLTAIDGDLQGGDGQDKFRIRIWSDGGGLIYDNQLNAPDSVDPTTVLGGGSIVIHK